MIWEVEVVEEEVEKGGAGILVVIPHTALLSI